MNELRIPLIDGKCLGVGVSGEEYVEYGADKPRGHPERVMSRSELMRFMKCPRKWIRGAQDEDTDSTDWGSLVDCLALTPDQFAETYIVRPETYPAPATHDKVKKGVISVGAPLPWNANAKYCEDWATQHDGLEIVKPDDMVGAQRAIKNLKDEPEIAELLSCSKAQAFCIATYVDKDTGIKVPLKVLLDLVPDSKHQLLGKSAADLKTAKSADLKKWPYVIDDRDYDVQAALHIDVLVAATKQDRNTFHHIIVENTYPFEPAKAMLSTEALNTGRIIALAALKRYCRCHAEKRWPGYEDGMKAIYGWPIAEPTQRRQTLAMELMST